ncbi:MAG: DUF1513 domain-containing protein [Bdellovibrionales bacterium]
MRPVSRRQVLYGLGLATATIGAGALRSFSDGVPWLVGSFDPNLQQNVKSIDYLNAFSPDNPGDLVFYNPTTKQIHRIALPFVSHSFVQSPTNPWLGLALGRWTPAAAWVNLRQFEVERLLMAPNGFRFFGHGVFSKDGQTVLISGNSNDNKEGVVLAASTKLGSAERMRSSGGLFPHDIQWYGDKLAIMNSHTRKISQSPAAFALIEPNQVDSFEVPYGTHFHLGAASAVVGSKIGRTQDLTLTEITFNPRARVDLADRLDRPLKGEALSFAETQDWIFITSATANSLLRYSKDRRRLETMQFQHPVCGVSILGEQIFLSSWHEKGPLFRVIWGDTTSGSSLELPSFSNGSHIQIIMRPV